jgi:molecular chaperone GrpE
MEEEAKNNLSPCKEKIEELQKELETAKALADEYLNGWKRSKADLINFQKDIERQRESWIKFTTTNIVLEILPIYESMEKLIEQIAGLPPVDNTVSCSTKLHCPGLKLENTDSHPNYEAFFEGFKNIKKQLDDLFRKLGVLKIKTVGEKFDPKFHEAIGVRKVEGKESDTILEEVQAGYLMNDEVIRTAKVVVAE